MKEQAGVPLQPRHDPLPSLAQILRRDYGLSRADDGTGRAASAAADPDPVTGLPTLAQMGELIRCLIGAARRSRHALAVVTVRLDGFTRLAQLHDGTVCEALLRQTGAVLAAEARHCGSVAYVAEGDFLVILHELNDCADAAFPVRRMLDALGAAQAAGSFPLSVTATAGIAVFPADGDDFDTLLGKAGAATRGAGRPSRGSLRFHSNEFDLLAKQRWRLETGLREAVQRHDLGVHYQPQFDLQTGRLCGVEALARWFLADGSAVGPSVFIPVAERTGLMGELGAWVLELACATVSGWHAVNESPPTLGVNVSPQQLDHVFPALIGARLARSGFPADRLELEVTESALSADPYGAIECLEQWKQLGVRIAVDHFGVGFSSLSYLTRLPIDRLKIDKSLIHNMTFERRSAAIVRSVISLARELGVAVLAEGVETERQVGMLQSLGCEQAQGYLFAHPVPAKEARALLAKSWGRRLPPPAFEAAVPGIGGSYAH